MFCDCRGITFNRTPAQVINILTQHPSGKGLFFPEGADVNTHDLCYLHVPAKLVGTSAHSHHVFRYLRRPERKDQHPGGLRPDGSWRRDLAFTAAQAGQAGDQLRTTAAVRCLIAL